MDSHANAPENRLAAAVADRYRLEHELGAGGMATVYLAHDLKHDRDVAIKVLHPDLGAALGGDRFLSEIRTTARLQHPHILPLLDSGDAGGLLYYVMPLVTGETLRARLTRERQLPIESAVLIAREVADALGYAHGLGVIHRDIKPENILLQGGHALVADFGIALAVQTAAGSRMTQTGLSLGTPQYMSPEQAMGERSIDARSDIYALGAVTYEMLTGEPPFTGHSVQAIVARLLTEEPRAIGVQRKAVPPLIEAAVMRALEKLPADRYASAGEFAAALRDGPAAAVPLTAAGRRSWRLAAASVALLVLGAAAGWAAAHLIRPVAATSADAVTETSILPPAGGVFGEQRSLALSPDGRRLAFVLAGANGTRSLWVRQLDRLDATPIPNTAGASAPFWSPDGRSIGFFSAGQLAVVDESGEARRLCQITDAAGGSWSTSGVILFGSRDGIFTVPAEGGECRRIVAPGAWPPPRAMFLPGGERFIYARGAALDMLVADLNGKTLDSIPVRPREFVVAPPNYLIATSRTDARGVDVWRLDIRTLKITGNPVRLVSDVRNQGGIHTIAVSSNDVFAFLPSASDRPYLVYDATGVLRDTVRVEGTWTASARPRAAGPPTVAVAGASVGVWLYDLDANRATLLASHDTSFSPADRASGIRPVFSADGSHLLFLRGARGRCLLIDRDLASDAERVVLDLRVDGAGTCPQPLSWSTDGKRLLARRDTLLEILSTENGATLQRLVRPGRMADGSFSPDGRSVAYSSEETGRAEIYVQTLPAGGAMRVSLEGGRWPAWIHAGTAVTFLTPDGRVQQAELGAQPGVPPVGALQPGAPRTLFAVPTWRRSTFDDQGVGFAVIGDGERYLLRQSPTGLAVAYVQHWPALLRRGGGAAAPAP